MRFIIYKKFNNGSADWHIFLVRSTYAAEVETRGIHTVLELLVGVLLFLMTT